MKRYVPLLFIFVSASTQLVAGSVASASVHTDTTILGPGGTICNLTSSGAPISCSSGIPGNPFLVTADASASAGVGSLSLHADTGELAGTGVAMASASYDWLLFFPGVSSGIITGNYSLTAITMADFTTVGPNGSLSVSQQGSTTLTFPIPHTFLASVTLDSPFTAGQTLEISGSGSLFTSTPGEENSTASIILNGFFDQAGHQLAFTTTTVSEPAFWPLSLVLLAAIVWARVRMLKANTIR